jgi:hypothetical protein
MSFHRIFSHFKQNKSLYASALLCTSVIHSSPFTSQCSSSINDNYPHALNQETDYASYSYAVRPPFPRKGPCPVTWDDNWDLRNDLHEKEKTKAIHQIVLIRHGQYTHNEAEDHDHKLTELGKRQASFTGKRLHELLRAGIIAKPKKIFFSTMPRATETWEKIQHELHDHLPTAHNIEPCSMVREAAVCQPIPISEAWKPTAEAFFKNQQRVRNRFKLYLN